MQARPNSTRVGRIETERFADGATLSETYTSAVPFPHIVLDERFPPKVLDAVREEILEQGIEAEIDFYGSYRKHRLSDVRKMGPATRALIEDLNSAPMIEFLEKLTGIDGLIPDPHLEGGGVHQIGIGGFLKVHTDFNWHRRLRLHRRINLLIYLNEGWDESWQGHLELWDDALLKCGARIAPIMNRMVIFSTNDKSYHGHPEPLACPPTRTRNSIAMYYYSADRPSAEVNFGRSERTNYRERPGEEFASGKAKHAVHQILIRFPLIRKIIGR